MSEPEREEVAFDIFGGDTSPSPTGSWRTGMTTYTETHPLLLDGITALIRQAADKRFAYVSDYPKLTVHHCWSGYSEYTITSTWDEVDIQWGEHHFYFEHLSEMFKALEAATAWMGRS